MWNGFVVLLLVAAAARGAVAQTAATPEIGANPYKSYSGGDIDHVQMQNGSLYLSIPLLSYPQLGKLRLSFSLLANGPQYQEQADCDTAGYCEFYYAYSPGFNCPTTGSGNTGVTSQTQGGGQSGALVVVDQDLALSTCFRNPVESASVCDEINGVLCYSNNAFTFFGVIDSTNATHTLGYNQSNWSVLQATDGSGYTVQMPWANSLNAAAGNDGSPNQVWCGANTVISDSSGIKETMASTCYPPNPSEDGPATNVVTFSDPAGNTIQRSSSQGYAPLTTNIVDSVGRQIPDPIIGMVPDTPTSSLCPNLGIAGEPVVYSASWTVPGYQQSPETYHFCYTRVNIATNFFGEGPGVTETQDGPVWHQDPWGLDNYYEFVTYEDISAATGPLQSVVLPNGTSWSFVYDTATPQHPESYGDLLQVILPSGGSINYTYNWITLCGATAPGEGQPLGRAVASRTLEPLIGEPIPATYSYLQAPPNSAIAQSIETDAYGNDTIHAFSLDYPIGMGCGAEETATKWYQGSSNGGTSGTVLKEVDTLYTSEMDPQQDPSDLPHSINVLPQTATTLLNGQVENTVAYNYDTLFTASQPYSANYAPPEVFPTTSPIRYLTPTFVDDGIKRTTTVRQAAINSAYQAANLLTLPQSVTVANESGNAVSHTTYAYDESTCSPSGIFGNLTSVTKDYGTKTSWCYNDPYGMETSTTDPNGNAGITNGTTKYSYDSSWLYINEIQAPTTSNGTTPIPHIRYFQQDPNMGWTTAISDENASSIGDLNHVTQYSYDFVGRITQVKYPDGGGLVNQCYTDAGGAICSKTSAPFSVISQRQQNLAPTPTYLTSTAEYDGLGRPYQTIAPSGAITDTTYDLDGRVISVSNPHYTTASATDGITSYVYDPLGRKLFQCQPDNLPFNSVPCNPSNSYQSWSYTGNTVTFQDEIGNQWRRTTDVLGRLIQVRELGSAAMPLNLSTNYAYDTLNNLVNIYQFGNGSSDVPRLRTFNYDSLSRLLCASNPESASAACPPANSGYIPGTLGYTYDPNGNVKSKTDARGVTTNYSYDFLNRLLAKTYTNAPLGTLSSCYAYDSSRIGSLYAEWTETGYNSGNTASCPLPAPASGYQTMRTFVLYDPMGRITSEQQCAPSTSGSPGNCTTSSPTPFALTYTYDSAGNLTQYSNGLSSGPQIVFTPQYDGAGRLSTLTSNWQDPTHPSILFTADPADGYTAPGGIQDILLGNNITVTKTYDNRLRTTGELVTHP
jgi:YD repeat-containing protein